ncbi:MAG: 2-amino-4-hydroxy-6-hydroxymethyldihydropteridine diphosphokinase [Ruminococcus sp.]
MDKIYIKNLELFAKHGVFPEENVLGQKFVVSAVLYTDIREAGRSDDLTKSIHYGEVSHQIKEYVENHTFQLLERVAEGLAEELLLTVPRLSGVKLEIKKPWAPVGLPLETVSVEIQRQWHRAYIALGSNMGDKKGYLDQAVAALDKMKECRVGKVSDFIVTSPYGGVEQDDFLNGVLELSTILTPEELLERLHEIEKSANRERVVRWGPRTLDLDILLYDSLVMDTEELHIPHIDMHRRDFVLKPLNQIASWVRHPVLGCTIGELWENLEKTLPQQP